MAIQSAASGASRSKRNTTNRKLVVGSLITLSSLGIVGLLYTVMKDKKPAESPAVKHKIDRKKKSHATALDTHTQLQRDPESGRETRDRQIKEVRDQALTGLDVTSLSVIEGQIALPQTTEEIEKMLMDACSIFKDPAVLAANKSREFKRLSFETDVCHLFRVYQQNPEKMSKVEDMIDLANMDLDFFAQHARRISNDLSKETDNQINRHAKAIAYAMLKFSNINSKGEAMKAVGLVKDVLHTPILDKKDRYLLQKYISVDVENESVTRQLRNAILPKLASLSNTEEVSEEEIVEMAQDIKEVLAPVREEKMVVEKTAMQIQAIEKYECLEFLDSLKNPEDGKFKDILFRYACNVIRFRFPLLKSFRSGKIYGGRESSLYLAVELASSYKERYKMFKAIDANLNGVLETVENDPNKVLEHIKSKLGANFGTVRTIRKFTSSSADYYYNNYDGSKEIATPINLHQFSNDDLN